MSVTRRDIVRYLNDEVSDPDELQRIEVELARDPQLQQWYRELDFESMVPSEPARTRSFQSWHVSHARWWATADGPKCGDSTSTAR